MIFRVGLAMLEHSQSSLLHMDMEDMLKVCCLLCVGRRD